MNVKREKALIVVGLCVVLVIGAYLTFDALTPDRLMLPEDSAEIIAQYPEIIQAAENLSGKRITAIDSFTINEINALMQEAVKEDPLKLREFDEINNDIIDAILRYKTLTQKVS